MNRRHFLLSSIGMLAAGRAEAKLDGYEILLGKLDLNLSLIHISEPTRQAEISYAVFCLKKKKKYQTTINI